MFNIFSIFIVVGACWVC